VALADDAGPEAGKAPMDKAAAENPFPNRFPAPGLEGGIEWMNARGEITLKDLRGKVVLLDFWTYCCINCMHVLPDLEYLEKKYPKELVVIGVHSAKFDNEKDSESIRQAIVRYEIEHPVVNDANMTIWRKYGVRAWPTLVLIDPEGNYCGYISGEGNRELLDLILGKVIAYHRAKGTLDDTPVNFALEAEKAAATPLRYPGKILADAERGRLFISDSNHNRIVVAGLDGKVIDVIGSGAVGNKDGDFATAEFDHPQGMALQGEMLYVADTENHLLRAVDLGKKTVTRLAGTGVQSRDRWTLRDGAQPALRTAINSPWDLALVGDQLYIAMAGPHQIWKLDLTGQTLSVFSGSGREDVTNGPHREAAYAQPSGLATDGTTLYVVDSEGSAIRAVDLDPVGEARTIVGASDEPGGRALFEFGDRDGIGEDVRLQHPLGIALSGGMLFVADSYNHKIKAIDLKTASTTTVLGKSKAGQPRELNEPAGLAVVDGKLFIADTNHHRIRVYDPRQDAVQDLELAGLSPPPKPKLSRDEPVAAVELPDAAVAAGPTLEFEYPVVLPEGYKIAKDAPVTARIEAEGEQTWIPGERLESRIEGKVEEGVVRFALPVDGAGEARLKVSVSLQYCRAGIGGLCKLKREAFVVSVAARAGADARSVVLKAPAK